MFNSPDAEVQSAVTRILTVDEDEPPHKKRRLSPPEDVDAKMLEFDEEVDYQSFTIGQKRMGEDINPPPKRMRLGLSDNDTTEDDGDVAMRGQESETESNQPMDVDDATESKEIENDNEEVWCDS